MIEVVEIQLLVVHCVAPIDIDGDASNSAKFMPDNVSVEPPPAGHPLTNLPTCLVTPHVGSRTHESVQRQAMAAVTNLLNCMRGEKPLAQINPEVPVKKVV